MFKLGQTNNNCWKEFKLYLFCNIGASTNRKIQNNIPVEILNSQQSSLNKQNNVGGFLLRSNNVDESASNGIEQLSKMRFLNIHLNMMHLYFNKAQWVVCSKHMNTYP